MRTLTFRRGLSIRYDGQGTRREVNPSPHLTACPFAALPVEDGELLIERYALAAVPATRLVPELMMHREDDQTPALLLVGDVDFGVQADDDDPRPNRENAPQVFTRLPSPDLELKPISTAFRSRFESADFTPLRGPAATEANVRRQIGDAEFLHFHTHGFCLPESTLLRVRGSAAPKAAEASAGLRCGIALAGGNRAILRTESTQNDGILWAEEIADLDLHAAELVVLSACQTALGDIAPSEGMLGAQRALMVAGAHSTVTTLWAVENRSTSAFMASFYQYMWRERLSKSKAMQQAMISMLRTYRWSEESPSNSIARHRTPPILWAGFVLHGDWN